jgi:HAE1 family hydrophobic/amphiphilic exporter-1
MVGLWWTGQTLNVFSFIGLIMLMGLVAKNAILLLDFTGRRRREGQDLRTALMEAGTVRLRPILMTTATMVMAMLPLAIGSGAGSEDRQPVAIVVIGGVLTSTLLTLVVVPVVYSYFAQFSEWLRRHLPSAVPAPQGSPTGD